MNFRIKESIKRTMACRGPRLPSVARLLTCISLLAFTCGFPAAAISQQAPAVPEAQKAPPVAPETSTPTPPTSGQALTGSIEGTVADQSGNGVAGAQVRLKLVDQSLTLQVICDDNGQFSFSGVAAGPFRLTFTAPGFTSQSESGILHLGETYTTPRIVLALAAVVTEVKVTPPRAEMAKYQLEFEEKQRVLGVFPNFYVSYFKDPIPLSPKQKFRLAGKVMIDPVSFGVIAAVAGVEQGLNSYSGFGQGAEGYAKRYGAAYADFAIGSLIGSAALPSLLKQDPRYFFKGTGSRRSRFLYAVTRAVIWKGDNGRWQPAYSSFIGNFAAGSISNLYYPAQNRSGVELTIKNGLIGIGTDAVINVLEEFVIPKLTPPLAASQLSGH